MLPGAPWIPSFLRDSEVKPTVSEGTSSRTKIDSILLPGSHLAAHACFLSFQQGPTEASLAGVGTFTLVPQQLRAGAEVVRREGPSDLVCRVSICGQGAILGEPPPCPRVDNGEVNQADLEGSGLGQ